MIMPKKTHAREGETAYLPIIGPYPGPEVAAVIVTVQVHHFNACDRGIAQPSRGQAQKAKAKLPDWAKRAEDCLLTFLC